MVVSTAAFRARVRGSVPGLGSLQETKMFLPHPRVKVSIVGSLRDREVACSASDRQGSNFESCVWRTVSSQSSHYPQEVLLAQSSLYVHKGGLKPDSFHFIFVKDRNYFQPKTYLRLSLSKDNDQVFNHFTPRPKCIPGSWCNFSKSDGNVRHVWLRELTNDDGNFSHVWLRDLTNEDGNSRHEWLSDLTNDDGNFRHVW